MDLVCSPGGSTIDEGRSPAAASPADHALEVERRDVLVADHERDARRPSVELAEALQQADPDVHLVVLAAGLDSDGAHRARRVARVACGAHAATAAITLSATQERRSRPPVRTTAVDTSP